jgi:hypothetical protein
MSEWTEPKNNYVAGDEVVPAIFNTLGENEKHLKEISCQTEIKKKSGETVTVNGIIFVEV